MHNIYLIKKYRNVPLFSLGTDLGQQFFRRTVWVLQFKFLKPTQMLRSAFIDKCAIDLIDYKFYTL